MRSLWNACKGVKHKKVLILVIAVFAAIVLVFGGYNIYRYPVMFRSLPDYLFGEVQTEELKGVEQLKGDGKCLTYLVKRNNPREGQ